jgi:hypothetical protein
LLFSAAAHAAAIPVASLTLDNANAEPAIHRGSAALKVTSKDGKQQALAIIKGRTFHNGTIDIDVSGAPAKGAPADARGFIGVIFRKKSDSNKFEIIYLRPTNGRADDQARRNHTVQYSADPDWPWDRLRKETPGLYESYADMEAGEWVHMRIVVKGLDAALYVNHASQPCLLVHDLKLGDSEGDIALWVGSDTERYFRDLHVTQ